MSISKSTALLFVVVCALLMAMTTAAFKCKTPTQDDPTAVDCKPVIQLHWIFNRRWDYPDGKVSGKKISDKQIWQILDTIQLAMFNAGNLREKCPDVDYKVQTWFEDEGVEFDIYYFLKTNDTTVGDECYTAIFAERSTISTSVRLNNYMQERNIFPTALQIVKSAAPLTCFNGIQDEGETSVDCGYAACEMKCQAGKKCNSDQDCIGNCFPDRCMIFNTATHTTVQQYTLAVLAIVTTFAMFM